MTDDAAIAAALEHVARQLASIAEALAKAESMLQFIAAAVEEK
jgi:hypothetical protein